MDDMNPTGRSARFYAPVTSEDDIEAIAQRVAQFVAVGMQRGELDGVQITMQEASRDDDGTGDGAEAGGGG
jgi:acyl dehydratase